MEIKSKGNEKLEDVIVVQKCWLVKEQLALRKLGG